MAQRQQRWRPVDPPSLVTGMENRRGWPDLQTETGWSLLLRPFAIKKIRQHLLSGSYLLPFLCSASNKGWNPCNLSSFFLFSDCHR
ncbi:hypothetical protein MRB53_008580 [Persea americana]|uniref:Uncharacterized protein n=1 Tax=Persea americana TaxID=3435 RepID=A0ACC2MNY3_PERAE|nr:hypothetical protein MRB53_008580 [Persea americana]